MRRKGLCRTFELQIAPEVYARADESYYIRLLVNLLENAVYYGKENGMVKVTLSKNGKMIEGIVEDNGIRISQEDLVHIWERFYRADPARSTDSHSGLESFHGEMDRGSSRRNDPGREQIREGTRFILKFRNKNIFSSYFSSFFNVSVIYSYQQRKHKYRKISTEK